MPVCHRLTRAAPHEEADKSIQFLHLSQRPCKAGGELHGCGGRKGGIGRQLRILGPWVELHFFCSYLMFCITLKIEWVACCFRDSHLSVEPCLRCMPALHFTHLLAHSLPWIAILLRSTRACHGHNLWEGFQHSHQAFKAIFP